MFIGPTVIQQIIGFDFVKRYLAKNGLTVPAEQQGQLDATREHLRGYGLEPDTYFAVVQALKKTEGVTAVEPEAYIPPGLPQQQRRRIAPLSRLLVTLQESEKGYTLQDARTLDAFCGRANTVLHAQEIVFPTQGQLQEGPLRVDTSLDAGNQKAYAQDYPGNNGLLGLLLYKHAGEMVGNHYAALEVAVQGSK